MEPNKPTKIVFWAAVVSFLLGCFIVHNKNQKEISLLKEQIAVYEDQETLLLQYKEHFENLVEDPIISIILKSSWGDDLEQANYFVFLLQTGMTPKEITDSICELNKLKKENGN